MAHNITQVPCIDLTLAKIEDDKNYQAPKLEIFHLNNKPPFLDLSSELPSKYFIFKLLRLNNP